MRRDASCEIGRFCSSGRRNIRTGTRCRRAARRTGGWSWRGSWGRGRHCHQFTAQTTVAGAALCVKNSQNKGQNEKNPGQPAGEFRQHVGCLRTENILRDPTTKGRAKTLAFRPLHQNDECHQHCNQHVDSEQNVDDNVHLRERGICRASANTQTVVATDTGS